MGLPKINRPTARSKSGPRGLEDIVNPGLRIRDHSQGPLIHKPFSTLTASSALTSEQPDTLRRVEI